MKAGLVWLSLMLLVPGMVWAGAPETDTIKWNLMTIWNNGNPIPQPDRAKLRYRLYIGADPESLQAVLQDIKNPPLDLSTITAWGPGKCAAISAYLETYEGRISQPFCPGQQPAQVQGVMFVPPPKPGEEPGAARDATALPDATAVNQPLIITGPRSLTIELEW